MDGRKTCERRCPRTLGYPCPISLGLKVQVKLPSSSYRPALDLLVAVDPSRILNLDRQHSHFSIAARSTVAFAHTTDCTSMDIQWKQTSYQHGRRLCRPADDSTRDRNVWDEGKS
jgi:hypothetical protein